MSKLLDLSFLGEKKSRVFVLEIDLLMTFLNWCAETSFNPSRMGVGYGVCRVREFCMHALRLGPWVRPASPPVYFSTNTFPLLYSKHAAIRFIIQSAIHWP
jgi:hypothetical protein